MSCCTPTNSCSSALPETCEALPATTTGIRVIVENEANCKRALTPPENPSVLQHDASGEVAWKDGSAANPVSLPSLQSQAGGTTPKLLVQNPTGEVKSITGTAAAPESEVMLHDGTNWVPTEVSKQFGTGTGILVRDVAAPSKAQWRKGTDGQVLITDANGDANWGGVPSSFPINAAGGRLTLSSGTPVMVADVLTASTLYYTPFISNQISVYTGSTWELKTFAELSVSLGGLAADTNFDVFIYSNAGVMTLELTAWTNNTTRATDLVRQDGVLCKTGALTRRYIGTIRTTGTIGLCEMSFGSLAVGGTAAKLFVWNACNRLESTAQVGDTTNSWTYGTAAWRASNNSSGMRANFVVGLQEDAFSASFGSGAAGASAAIGVGYDSVTAFSGTPATNVIGDGTMAYLFAAASVVPAIGYHYVSAIENPTAAVSITFFGDNGSDAIFQNRLRLNIRM